jgi:anthranilate synthase/aminodeoxychorismate synthase-like glutamine amidotransferase
MRLFLVDNYDSFTFNLFQQFLRVGAPIQLEVSVVRNDSLTVTNLLSQSPQAIVISPGPGRPSDAGISIDLIRAASGIVPLLGVCLGHQAIAQAFGAKIIRAPKAIHGETTLINHASNGLFQFIDKPIHAARYHSLVIDKDTLSSDFEVTATAKDNSIMAIEHHNMPLWGVQFHPESFLTEQGDQIIENFLAHVTERAAGRQAR